MRAYRVNGPFDALRLASFLVGLLLFVDNVAASNAALHSKAIAAGENHTCALTAKGSIRCWGKNDWGQLGDGSETNRLVPVSVPNKFSIVTTGGTHTCGVTSKGRAQCWGFNLTGQLGNGDDEYSTVPVFVKGLKEEIVSVVAGLSSDPILFDWGSTCAILVSGRLKCWGYNAFGKLGNGSNGESHVPVNVIDHAAGVVSVAVGQSHTCSVDIDSRLRCWGYNSYGQLGLGKRSIAERRPSVIPGFQAQAVTVGDYHTCAIDLQNKVFCWGMNGGVLGDGGTHDQYSPTPVKDLASDVKEIAAGSSHTCALTNSGTVKCWGRNFYGQLGGRHLTSGIVAIASGADHSCAITNRGKIKCWGRNDFGQLGDGTKIDRGYPVNVDEF